MPSANTVPTATDQDDTPAREADAASASPTLKFAAKTSLSLTLAYLIPMALGWPQPQTAAITVMLIAATGALSESLQKGVSRILGTVAGAIIGLCLIALFPQDRLTYLLAASLAVSMIIYLYNAYQGDSTVFMLTAVVTLMVFNGGDAEGAFIYGIDRAFMTVFGVAVYSLVSSLLWPQRIADNTRSLAANIARGYEKLSAATLRENTPSSEQPYTDSLLADLLAQTNALKEQFAKIKGYTGIADYTQEWNAILSCFEQLQGALLPVQNQPVAIHDYQRFITNYEAYLLSIETRFGRVLQAWEGNIPATILAPVAIELDMAALQKASHLETAYVVGRAELVRNVQTALIDLESAISSLFNTQADFHSQRKAHTKPTFVFLDLESFKTAVRAFTAFWIATAIWLAYNPPGGFMFVTLCTVFIPLVSYTPATPKLLMILFTLSFAFAVPAYVFLLPQMTHWLALGLFIFAYAFIGLMVFPGPVAIFFLLGLFTLGIQNSMSYNFNILLLIMLMFYMVCATHIIALYFPFTSRPEKIYTGLQRRFFLFCARKLREGNGGNATGISRFLWQGVGPILLGKMEFWGTKIDGAFFPDNGLEKILALNKANTLLLGEIETLTHREKEFSSNTLIKSVREGSSEQQPMVALCTALANNKTDEAFRMIAQRVVDLEDTLDKILGEDYLQRYDQRELAQFYSYLNIQACIMRGIENCRHAQQALNWQQLAQTRF